MPRPTILPEAVRHLMSGDVQPGERNQALYAAAVAWLGQGESFERVESDLSAQARRYGLPESEIRSVLASARNSNAAADGAAKAAQRDSAPVRGKYQHLYEGRNGFTPRVKQIPSPTTKTPDTADTELPGLPGVIPGGALALVQALFRDGDFITFRPQSLTPDGEPTWAGHGKVWSYETVTARLAEGHPPEKLFPPAGFECGLGIMVNPAKGAGLRNVLAFRHGLLEWDQGTLSQQWEWIKASSLPIAAVVYSGGKSLHAIVRFDAPDERTFRARAQAALDHIARLHLPPPDKCLTDPSRSCRFPEYPRGESRQDLIHLSIGAASWEEWEAENKHPLPVPLDLAKLVVADWDQDPDNLLGRRWLCRTRSAIFVGQSGTGKSTLIVAAAVQWALGRDFYGIKPVRPLKILYIQAENDNGDIGEMLQGMVKGGALHPDDWEAATANLTFLTEMASSGTVFLERLQRLISIHRPDLIIADPLMSYAGCDLARQENVGEFLRNGLNPILESSATRPAFIWVHHTGKPAADPKSRAHWTESDIQYLLFGSSDLTNWARSIMVLQRVKASEDAEEDAPVFCLHAVKRGNRAGLRDYDGLVSTRIYLRHSTVGQAWELCPDPKSDPQQDAEVPAHRPKKDWSTLQNALPMSRKELMAWLEREGYKPRQMIHKLIKSGVIRTDRHIPGHFEKA